MIDLVPVIKSAVGLVAVGQGGAVGFDGARDHCLAGSAAPGFAGSGAAHQGFVDLDPVPPGTYARRTATRAGQVIDLQPREFKLLEYLMRNCDRVVTRTMLLEAVWDYHFDPQTNVIDVHISRLRAKIDKGFEQPLLHTVRGAGYRLGSL